MWTGLRIILKWTVKKKRFWLGGMEVIWSIYNINISVIIHDIGQKTMNILTSWSRCEILLCRYIGVHRLLMISYATFPAHWSAQNHITFLRSSSKALEPLISNAQQKRFSFSCTRTHPHTQVSKHCVYGIGKWNNLFVYYEPYRAQELFLFILFIVF